MQTRSTGIVVGLGETGSPLLSILRAEYGDEVAGYDPKADGYNEIPTKWYSFLNICIPYTKKFFQQVRTYQMIFRPTVTIVHSTVPVGTTDKLGDAVHAPVLGRHMRMREDMLTYAKWIGGDKKLAGMAAVFLEKAKFHCKVVSRATETELFKLMCLAKYGMSIAFADYQAKLCKKYGICFDDVLQWDMNYNDGVMPSHKRPLITPPMDGKIGGHCVIPGTKLLNKQFPNAILREVIRHG